MASPTQASRSDAAAAVQSDRDPTNEAFGLRDQIAGRVNVSHPGNHTVRAAQQGQRHEPLSGVSETVWWRDLTKGFPKLL